MRFDSNAVEISKGECNTLTLCELLALLSLEFWKIEEGLKFCIPENKRFLNFDYDYSICQKWSL